MEHESPQIRLESDPLVNGSPIGSLMPTASGGDIGTEDEFEDFSDHESKIDGSASEYQATRGGSGEEGYLRSTSKETRGPASTSTTSAESGGNSVGEDAQEHRGKSAGPMPVHWRPSWQRVEAHLSLAKQKKQDGNEAYKNNRIDEAILHYSASASAVHALEGVLADLEKAGVGHLPSRPDEDAALESIEEGRSWRSPGRSMDQTSSAGVSALGPSLASPVEEAIAKELKADGPSSAWAIAKELKAEGSSSATTDGEAPSTAAALETGTPDVAESGAGTSKEASTAHAGTGAAQKGSGTGAAQEGRTSGEYLQDLRSMVAKVYANRGQVKMKKKEWAEAIADCDEALDRDPRYLKAMLRRATCLEHLEQWEDAVEDWQDVLKTDPRSAEGRAGLARCEAQKKKKEEGMKEEMVGKLKDLGNMVLGNFGLSVDNFELKQDESGGYSVQFNQNPNPKGGGSKGGEGGGAVSGSGLGGGGPQPAESGGAGAGAKTSGSRAGAGPGGSGFSFYFDTSKGSGGGAPGDGSKEGGSSYPRPHEEWGEEEEDILEDDDV